MRDDRDAGGKESAGDFPSDGPVEVENGSGDGATEKNYQWDNGTHGGLSWSKVQCAFRTAGQYWAQEDAMDIMEDRMDDLEKTVDPHTWQISELKKPSNSFCSKALSCLWYSAYQHLIAPCLDKGITASEWQKVNRCKLASVWNTKEKFI